MAIDDPKVSVIADVPSSAGKDFGRPPLAPQQDDELPTNVTSADQLKDLPEECLSGIKERPLRHVDEDGQVFTYALNPMTYSVMFILMVELLERFCFYGINYTQTAYLTGSYNEDWNADMTSVEASSYVSVSVGVAYSTPFLGAYLGDALLGDYYGLLVGAIVFYLPGLTVIALTTIPHLLSAAFPSGLLLAGLIGLWPIGTGIVKSIVNVFGAKQFHPLLQSSLIESYYVSFYMCINIGALIGGILVPFMAQIQITIAYFIPVGMLFFAVVCFLTGTKKYVRVKPKGNLFGSKKKKKKKLLMSNVDTKRLNIFNVLKISALILPFNIAYAQMATTFIIQGTVMQKVWFIDAACMNNADAISVLFFGYVIGQIFYPTLAKKGIKLPTTHKFAMGSVFGVVAIGWALLMEYMIHYRYFQTGERVSIMWQAPSYILIGIGEIFAVSSAYEAAFCASPPEQKALASAVNLFCVGGLPNYFCILLYQACYPWFLNSRGTASLHRLEDYAEAHVWKYFLVLFGIAIFGVLLNLAPPVRNFVESIEEAAAEMVKTPKMTPSRPTKHKRLDSWDFSDAKKEDMSPLMRQKRHEAYLKYGSGPVLNRNSSMRAGPSLASTGKAAKKVKRSTVAKLYNSESGLPKVKVVMSPSGKPLQAGNLSPMQPHGGVDVSETTPLVRSMSNPDLGV